MLGVSRLVDPNPVTCSSCWQAILGGHSRWRVTGLESPVPYAFRERYENKTWDCIACANDDVQLDTDMSAETRQSQQTVADLLSSMTREQARSKR